MPRKEAKDSKFSLPAWVQAVLVVVVALVLLYEVAVYADRRTTGGIEKSIDWGKYEISTQVEYFQPLPAEGVHEYKITWSIEPHPPAGYFVGLGRTAVGPEHQSGARGTKAFPFGPYYGEAMYWKFTALPEGKAERWEIFVGLFDGRGRLVDETSVELEVGPLPTPTPTPIPRA